MQYREYQSDDLPQSQPASELASPWARLAAIIIDILVSTIVVGATAILASLALSYELDDTPLIILVIVASLAVAIVQWYLLGTRGQTIGKIAVGVRIVDVRSGTHPGWARLILLRNILNSILVVSIPLVGWLYLLVDSLFIFRDDHRTVHDLYSGTHVVMVSN